MTYDEAIRYWFGRINYEHKTPRPNDLSLDRIRALLDLLGRPQDRFRIVHVAGSKGKGSTAALIASILQQAGYRVGLFTSPHLESISERIRVDGQPISEAEMATALTDIAQASRSMRFGGNPGGMESLDESLTFFEISTALGFLHFARRRAELAVVEVGMGGRFDSTNVCRPEVAVITSISLDHTRQLGDTLGLIAAEKAGIIKPGRPVVSGVRGAEARAVIRAASRERSAPLKELGVDFDYRYFPSAHAAGRSASASIEIRTWRGVRPAMRLALLGEHQAANAATAVAAIELLSQQGMSIAAGAVVEGLARVDWPARLECVGQAPLVLLDCAHNVASAQALLQALDEFYPRSVAGRRILIFASSRDKDVAGMLAVLASAFDHLVLTRFRSNPRAMGGEELKAQLPAWSAARAEVARTPREAWQRARESAGASDLVCVAGSVFLAGEVRSLIGSESGLRPS